jgi:copper transport protein
MKRWSLAALALLTAVILFGAATARVAAHSYYERSEPPANAILENAPRQVRVWFTEEPELRFSELQVYDTAARRQDRGPTQAVPGEPRALAVAVGDLTPGTYTVVWRTLSTVDGHTARGAFPFTVGLDQIPAPMVIPAGAERGTTTVTPWSVASRWLNLLATVVLVAPFVVLPLVLGGGLRATANGGDTASVAAAWGVGRRRGLTLALVAAAVTLVAAVFALVVQAAMAADAEPWQALGEPLAALWGTRYSAIWIGRMLLILALGALAWFLRRPGVGAGHPGWLLGAVLGGLLLLTTSLNSHAAATQQGTLLAVAVDWLHLVATALWIGGLVVLVVALPATLGALPEGLTGRLLAATIPRFSVVGLAAVGVLVVTGLYQTWLYVGSVDALTSTPYGQALLAKIGLLLPLLGLGAANLLIISPRAAKAVRRGTRGALERLSGLERRFRQTTGAEVLLGILILLVVGLLTSLEPARDALRAQGVVRTLQVEDLRAVLRIAPGDAGLNTFDVALFEGGRPFVDAQRVTLRLEHVEHEMGVTEQRLDPVGDGHYRAMSGALSMAGPWKIEVYARRAGREDARAELEYTAADPGAARAQLGGTGPAAGTPPTRLLIGAAFMGLGVLFLIEAVRPRPRRRGQAATVALGCVATIAGLVLASLAAFDPSGGEAVIPNPVARTPASVARGQELYQQHCVVCHGLSGRGDGPLAATLNPRPADLRRHVADHTEGQLWLWVTYGVPGTAMPAFRETLSDEDRWHLINYLESQFGGGQTASAR